MKNCEKEINKGFAQTRKQFSKDFKGFDFKKMIKCLEKKTKHTLSNPMPILTDAIKCSDNKKKAKELSIKIHNHLFFNCPEVGDELLKYGGFLECLSSNFQFIKTFEKYVSKKINPGLFTSHSFSIIKSIRNNKFYIIKYKNDHMNIDFNYYCINSFNQKQKCIEFIKQEIKKIK